MNKCKTEVGLCLVPQVGQGLVTRLREDKPNSKDTFTHKYETVLMTEDGDVVAGSLGTTPQHSLLSYINSFICPIMRTDKPWPKGVLSPWPELQNIETEREE